ncbi:MAG: ABC transporter permease [Deltaproteobacteria bacterium]|nr:MAG: ABC transporter permease [Deltaproteobacteria bacterium]
MTPVLAIAGNTVKEATRNKVFYSIFFFALLIILNSFVFTELTIAVFDRILRDVATGAIDFFGALMAIFLGIGLVSREVDRKTIYTVITKPIRRSEFILGKFAGLGTVLVATLGAMYLSFLVVVFVFSVDPPPLSPLVWYFVLTLVELGVVVAFAIFVSTFSSSMLSAFFTVGMYVIGHLSGDLYFFGQRSESAAARWLSTALYYVLPNLSRFSVAEEVTYGRPVDGTGAALAILYGLLWMAAFLAAAILVFDRRDFK